MGKPYVIVSDFLNSSLQIAPLGSWNQFNAISGLVKPDLPSSISYDPVESQIYWVSYNETAKHQQIVRSDLNLMQEEILVTGLKNPGSGKLL